MGITGDFRGLANAIRQLEALASPKAMEKIGEKVGAQMATLVDESFEAARSPEGKPWAPLKSRNGQILQDSGKIRTSVHFEVKGDEVLVGTLRTYDTFHQFGTNGRKEASSRNQPVSKKGRFQSKKKAAKRKAGSVAFRELNFKQGGGGIPARPFLPDADRPLPAKWDRAIAEVIMTQIADFTARM